eukprot:CAMPEP_0202722068 /NCGR_PEP_ID=MMETSP1385-20130828/154151_1 /ASSEMBLY_ACC=CAM_ASM_000861 /TAXON_ID=933848 /ORGANISM="Elphidium margaritaceum" /LENGTH=72 /DNA_ID=CAMNT_0049386557 /DNA_START=9 /DNA_END=223 /DNA_ORIENTATION=+
MVLVAIDLGRETTDGPVAAYTSELDADDELESAEQSSSENESSFKESGIGSLFSDITLNGGIETILVVICVS